MGGALALRLAERLRLSRTFSVAGGWTMAWSTSRPPQAHARSAQDGADTSALAACRLLCTACMVASSSPSAPTI